MSFHVATFWDGVGYFYSCLEKYRSCGKSKEILETESEEEIDGIV